MVAALVLLLTSVYLIQKQRPAFYTIIPAIFMTITTIGALFYKMYAFFQSKNYLLLSVSAFLLILTTDMLVQAFKVLRKGREESKATLIDISEFKKKATDYPHDHKNAG